MWTFLQPIIEVGIKALLFALDQVAWAVYGIAGVFTYLIGGIFAGIGWVIDQLINTLSKIWDSAPMKFFREKMGAIADFGYSGTMAPATAGAQATGSGMQYDMVANSSSYKYSIGSQQLYFANPAGNSSAVGAAAGSSIVGAFDMVRKAQK